MSATTDSYFVDPHFEDTYFVNFAGSPTIVTRSQTAPITASARSRRVWPPNSRKALSVFMPMRELLPPARRKPMRDRSVRPIWKSIRPEPRYTKVTYPERRSRRKMDVSDWYGGTTRHHAAKTHGCSYAGTLFTRVFLAAPRGQWKVLPSLPGVRDRLPVRLEDHASRRSGRRTGSGNHDRPTPLRSKTTDLDAPGAAPAIEPSGSIPREKPQYLVRGRDPEHQPVGRNVSRPTATAGECVGGTDLRDAARNLRTKEQQCTLPGKADLHQGRG